MVLVVFKACGVEGMAAKATALNHAVAHAAHEKRIVTVLTKTNTTVSGPRIYKIGASL